MSTNERDTHFANFAELLLKEIWPHLPPLFNNEPPDDNDEAIQKTVEQIIARRAYDLVMHTLRSITETDLEYAISKEAIIAGIPDFSLEN